MKSHLRSQIHRDRKQIQWQGQEGVSAHSYRVAFSCDGMFWNQTVEMVAPTPEHTTTMEIKRTSWCVNSISMKLLYKTKEQARGSHSNGVKGMAEWDVQSRFFLACTQHRTTGALRSSQWVSNG